MIDTAFVNEYVSGSGRLFRDRTFTQPVGILGYLSSDCRSMTDWHGNLLGTARITSTWQASWTVRMYQVEARIAGVLYTGRSQGAGMLWVGRPKAKQPKE